MGHEISYRGLILSVLALLAVSASLPAQGQQVDFRSEEFSENVRRLEAAGDNSGLYGLMVQAARQAESEENVARCAAFWEQAATYARAAGNMENFADAMITSSKYNRDRGFAGTSIRQLILAEETLAGQGELLAKVNEAQVANYEHFGDVGNAYLYYKKVSSHRLSEWQKRCSELQRQLTDIQNDDIVMTDQTAEAGARRMERRIARAEREAARIDGTAVPSEKDAAPAQSADGKGWTDAALWMQLTVIVALVLAFLLFRRSVRRRMGQISVRMPERLLDEAAQAESLSSEICLGEDAPKDLRRYVSDSSAVMRDVQGYVRMDRTLRGNVSDSCPVDYDIDTLMKDCRRRMQPCADAAGVSLAYKSTGSQTQECDPAVLGLMLRMMTDRAISRTLRGGKVSMWIETDGGSVTMAVETQDGERERFLRSLNDEAPQAPADDDGSDAMFRTLASAYGMSFFHRCKDGDTYGLRLS